MNLALNDGDDPTLLDLSSYADTGRMGQKVVLQNLSGGPVYFDRVDDVDDTTGVQLTEGDLPLVLEVSRAPLYLVAVGADADVRFTVIG